LPVIRCKIQKLYSPTLILPLEGEEISEEFPLKEEGVSEESPLKREEIRDRLVCQLIN
jgi:hypothetical protein